MGNYEKAEPLYLEAINRYFITLGPIQSDFALWLDNLGCLYHDMGKYEKADSIFMELYYVNQKLINNSIHHLTESEINS